LNTAVASQHSESDCLVFLNFNVNCRLTYYLSVFHCTLNTLLIALMSHCTVGPTFNLPSICPTFNRLLAGEAKQAAKYATTNTV